jgi:3-methyladenine DNA glycosylase AlkC
LKKGKILLQDIERLQRELTQPSLNIDKEIENLKNNPDSYEIFLKQYTSLHEEYIRNQLKQSQEEFAKNLRANYDESFKESQQQFQKQLQKNEEFILALKEENELLRKNGKSTSYQEYINQIETLKRENLNLRQKLEALEKDYIDLNRTNVILKQEIDENQSKKNKTNPKRTKPIQKEQNQSKKNKRI